MDSRDIARIVQSESTVSDKIRALATGGVPRAEIARLLGKRYQHVRNVLEGDKVSAMRPGVSEGEAQPFRAEPEARPPESRGSGVFRLEMDGAGRVALPPELIAAWNLKAGSALMGHLDGEAFELISGPTSARRILEYARQIVPLGGPSWSAELIADRRREAARESSDD